MTDVTVTVIDPSAELRLHRLTGAFLAGYRNANTRNSYLQQLHRWFAWCTAHHLDPLTVERTHVELALPRHEVDAIEFERQWVPPFWVKTVVNFRLVDGRYAPKVFIAFRTGRLRHGLAELGWPIERVQFGARGERPRRPLRTSWTARDRDDGRPGSRARRP